MPLTDPFEKPPIEELESLIPGVAPTKHSILPDIKTNKSLLYQTPGESENSEQLNLIETASGSASEFSQTNADAFIINKATDIISIPSANTSPIIANNTPRDSDNLEVDPLIGKLDSDLEDPLINPNPISSNNPSPDFNKPATNTQVIDSSNDKSELNKATADTTAASDGRPENTTQLPATAVVQSGQENSQKLPDVTADTTSEKAAGQTTVVPTAETTSKPEEHQTPLSSETAFKSESSPFKTSPATASTTDKPESNNTSPADISTANNLETATNLESDEASTPSTSSNFDSNAFTVDEKGIIGIEFTSDGGWYTGQLAIVNLVGMEKLVPGSEEFILEAASRALSNSTNGYIAISDDLEGAYYTNPNSYENFNSGEYLGKKTFAMKPGDKFFFMLVPNGTVQQVYDNPAIGGDKKPLFSIATENPNDGFSIGQIADITGEGQLFVMEDMAPSQGSYRDYDDITFRVTGATSQIVPLGELAGSDSASIHSELVQKLKGESDKSAPLFTRESTVTNSAEKSQEETPSLAADNHQQKPQQTAATVANSDSQESPLTETSTVANSDSQEAPATETSTVGQSDTQEAPATETSTVDQSDTQELQLIEQTASPPETLSVNLTELNSSREQPVEITAEKAANLIEDNTAFPEIASFSETEQLVTKTESIVARPEADDTVEPELTVAEITAEFESKQLPPKTDALPLSEDSADTIAPESAVTFTAAELETETPPAIVVNSLEIDPLNSDSNSNLQTDSARPTLFSNSSETAAGTAQTASVETSASPSTLNSPPSPISNTNNSNSTPTETTGSLPAYSENETAPKPADISSGLRTKEAEEPTLVSDGIADIVPNPTQGAGDFQSNTNSIANLSITAAAANSLSPGTFLVENANGQVKIDYQFDGGYYEGELGIFSLSGMSALTPGSPEFIAEAARRVLTNSTEGHIVIRDSIEGGKFTGAMPGEGSWGSGPYQGIKTFNMTPGDTFAVMLVPSGTVQSSLQFSWLWDLFPELRPLFSIKSANPNDTSYVLPIADATGTGNTFAMEDMSAANSDGDYNDLIFTVIGARGNAPLLDAVINPAKEWRNTPLGQELIEYANSLVEPTEPNETIVLVEGEIFANQYSQTLAVPASGSILNISLSDINFDTSDPKSINDALEIALVDNLGKSLVPTISPGKNAFFNSTEGQQSQLAPGVTLNGTTISVNLSQIAPGTAAQLQVRLVNNDSDTATRVGITSIAIQPSGDPTAQFTVSPDEGASTHAPVNFASLRDVSSSLEAEYKQTSFNSSSNILYADLGVKNTGQYPVRGSLLVGINNISDPTVRLLDADGITPEGIPYYDITKLVSGGILEPGELTSTDTLKFYNPEKVQFSYDLVFLSQLNQVPEFKAAPDAEALVGKGYVYSAIAVDADGDALTYSLLEKPQGMEIDAQTGIISWNPVAGDIGNHAVTVEASDGKGGVAQQKYVLSAINPPPNRPPIFTSTPVVDAAVNVPYTYEAIAKDPDSNPLTYSLVSSPAGMSVNPSTGQLTWTPTSDQLGLSEVVLKVTDGQGGTTEQAFKIQSQKEPGNHAPIITSEPETKAYVSKGYTYQLSSVDPDLDPLEYSLVAAPLGINIDPNTGEITWNNLTSSDVGQHEVTVKVKDNRGAVDTQTYTLNVSNVVPGELKGKVYLDDRQPLNTLVYFNDFEDKTRSKAEWSNPITDVTPRGNKGFLGQYSSISKNNPRGKTSLELTSLPEHDTVTVSFDLYVLKSWDGLVNWLGEPALWELNVENGPTLLQTTFSNVDFYWSWGFGQSYPDTYSPTTNNNPPRTGATETNTLGYSFYGDSTYNLSFTFDHKDSSLLLNFLGNAGNSGVTDINNESWGLDNVEVRVGSKGQGLSNWPVYLDSNGNNKRDLSEQFTFTDEQGNYSFTLEPGNYTVAQELPTGITQVVPTSNTYQVALAGNQTVKNLDFGNTNATLSNVPPSFLTQPPNDAMVGQKFRYRAVATDQNGDVLSYDLTVKPDGMVVDAKTGLVSWLPTSDQIGIQNAVLRVTDGNGGVDLQSFQTTVSPPNTLPIFLTGPGFGLPLNPTAVVGQPWMYQPRASDADNDPLAFSLAGAPEGMKVDSATGLVTWTPKTEQAGNHSITVTTSDGRGQPIAQTFNIEVWPLAANDNPIITSAPRLNTGLSRPYFYNVQAQDANGDPLTYTLATAPVGMTVDEKGRIFWQPNSAQFGSNPVTIVVSDGRSGVAEQEFAIGVSSYSVNQPPNIESEPFEVAIAQQPYQYNPIATDPDGDPLFWSLDAAPVGMSIDPETGKLRWQPSLEQVGSHEVAVRVMDTSGTYVGQAFTLNVRGVNVSPGIISTPPTLAAANKAYNYQVLARDAENDPLTFSLLSPPNGMTIDPQTGLIQWTPSESQVGVQNVGVLVSDSSGGTASQQYALAISETAINLPPAITSTPVFTASPGRPYSYQVTAADADGTISQYQLLQAPTGMTINSATGAITWDNPTAGNHQVVVGAVDNSGTGAAQGFELIARANSTPNVPTIPIQSVSPGQNYRYNLKATDANRDLLTFALIQSPSGMTVDEFGRISWQPSADNIGNHPVEVKVTDTFGESVTVSYNLSVVADTVAPKVSLIASNNTVGVGDSVTFTVNAVDNVKVESLGLTVNGTPVVLDAQGQATVKVNNLGSVTAVATALDAAGNPGTATQVVAAIDTSDVNAPTINIDLEDDAEITAPVNITGTINDSNLAYYTLEVAPVGGGEFKEVYRGTTAVNNGTVATFDPTVLANGAYTLKFTAIDANGNGSTTERTVNVAGDLKLGNFRLSFTDLTVPVAGIPISVTRTYDSLNANVTDDFGYGWRMEFRDTDLKTSLKPDPTFEELGINTVPFQSGTKVFITLPGGKRETFTFKPTPHHLNQYLGAAGPGAAMYKPAFESQKGSTMTLTVKDANLVRNENGEYYGVNAQPFNPENPAFGGIYILTTKEGLVYEIDAASGDLLTATDANGNKLTFSDAGIKSSSGKSVTFERDAAGRIVSVVDPDGKKVKYEYDAKGDLVAVKDREENPTQFKYEDEDRPHFLTEVIDPLGRSGVKTEYDDAGRLKYMVDTNGEKVELVYDPDNSIQKVKDVFEKETTYVYDSRGNVLTEIDPLGKRIDRTYDDDNNLLTETDADGVTTKYTYDNRRNLLTIEDEDGNITRMTYDNQGRATSIVSPTGLKTTAKYDSRGNLIESVDTDGLKTTYTYNARGQLRTQTAPDGQVNSFEYDAAGNIKRTIDSRGNVVDFDYNPNGRIEVATTTFTLNGQTHTLKMEYDYDTEGRITAARTSQGNNQSIIYDALGRVKSTTDVFGNVTTYRYDLPLAPGENTTPIAAVGRAVTRIDEVTLPDNTPTNSADNPKVINKYDAANNLIAKISPTGLETRYVYDALNRLTETILPDLTVDWTDNPKTKIEYSDGNRIKSQTDILGNKTQYFYNEIGQIERVVDAFNKPTSYTYNTGGQVETVTDYRNRKTQFVYDDKARVEEVIFFDNSRFKLTYDELGRVKTETNELNQTTTYEYDAKSQVKAVINANKERTEFEYDHRGNLIRVTDALKQSTSFKYDAYGQRVETTFHNNDKVSMSYDRFGRLTAYTDENLNPTIYSYDNLSQLTQIEQPKQEVNGQLQETLTKYTYDNLSRLEKIEDANKKVTEFEYDDFNRPTTTILPLGQRNRTDYNQFGQVTATTDFNGDTINYSYDSFGRLKDKNFIDPSIGDVSYTYDPVTTGLETVTDGRGITRYGYDNYDRLETVRTPDEKVVRYGYDLLNNITSLVTPNQTITYGYDLLNRLDTVKKDTRVLADYDYNAVGNLSQTKFANNSVEERKYDPRNRLAQITTKNSEGKTFSDFKYTLDGVGNRQKVEEYGGRTVDYDYDALNRLTQEKMAGGVTGDRTIDYTYDLVGNRLSRNDTVAGLANYVYDDNNRLRELTQGSQTTIFGYDNNGSIVQRSDGTQTVTYDWINDGENRLAGVTNSGPGGTSQTNFIYDAFGNRVASIADGVRTNYLTASAGGLPEVLMEYDAAGQVTADYTHGLGLVAATRNGREGFYHTDGIGSTRAITDSVGLVTDRYTYDAFGGLLDQTGTFGNSFQFAGEQRDSSTGLDYLRARYYDPSLGRFISKDAFSGSLSDPYSQHDYQYAHANPVRFTDPTGYSTVDIMATLSAVGALAAIGGTAGGIGFGVGYIGAAAAGGASGEEILGMFGDWGAGFANGVSGGYLTDMYEHYSGNKVEPTHGALWSAGAVTGIGVSFLLGMKLPMVAAASMGPLKWVATAGIAADKGFDVYGAATATGKLYNSYQDNGGWEFQDSWNLLAYLPFVGLTKGIRQGLNLSRKTPKLATPGADDVLANSKKMTGRAAGGPQCFVAGTEILTVDGIKNIEDIKVGDWVIADDPTTPGGIEAKQVLETFDNEVTELYDLYVDGEVISTTAEHPFWVPDQGWVKASDLVVGSLLQTDEETFVDVDRIERREGNFKVYNFEVEGIPTYFVSELGILVHNTCGDSVIFDAPRKAQTALNTLPNWTPKDKHLASTAAKRSAKFATDDPEEVRNIVQEALTSPNAVFESNNDGDSFRTIADLGRSVGTKGQNKVRVVIGPDSQGNWIIWNAFPQN